MPVLFGILWQIHFSAFALVPVCAAVVLLRARDVGWLKLGVGIAVAVGMLVPYLHFQRTHDWTDVRGFGNLASGKRADGSERPPEGALTLVALKDEFHALKDTFQTSGGTRFDYALGNSTDAYEATRGGAANALRSAGTWIAWGLMVIGLLVSLVRGSAGAVWRRRWPPLEPSSDGWPYLIVFGWLAGVWMFYVAVQLKPMLTHYLIIAFPMPFVLAALAAREPARRFGRRGLLVGIALVGLVAAAHVESLTSFGRFLDRTGGTAGDYGVGFGSKADLIRFVAGNGLGIRSAPGLEYAQLQEEAQLFQALGDLRTVRTATDIPRGFRGVDVHDTLQDPNARSLPCPGRHDFGPLSACPVP